MAGYWGVRLRRETAGAIFMRFDRSLIHTREIKRAFVWSLRRTPGDTLGSAVEDGPVGLRWIPERIAGWLLLGDVPLSGGFSLFALRSVF